MSARKRIAVIGGGPGGYVAAIRAAQLGAEVSLVEASELGGTCLNRGCIPSKALIHDVEVMESLRRSSDFGIRIGGRPEFDLAALNERRRKIVEVQVKGIHSLFKSRGIRVIRGTGRLGGRRTVSVAGSDGTDRSLEADAIIIATGSVPIRPSLFPFLSGGAITSEQALEPASIPSRIMIVGAGVEGSEFSFMYRGFGSEVTLVEVKDRVLPLEDEDLSGLVAREMRKKNISVHTGIRVQAVREDANRPMVTLSDGTESAVDRILVSVGRKPNSDSLGLEEAGVKKGPGGGILVDQFMETSVPGIYAIGDVVGKIMLAHVASMEGKRAAWNATHETGDRKPMNYDVIPAGIFTLPEIGTVGLREREAAERGIPVKIGRFPYRGLGRSHTLGELAGQVKVIASAKDHTILGVQAFGPHATDLIHEAAVAMRFGAKAEDIADLIHAHPTFPEVLMEAAEDVLGEAIHGPGP